MRAIPGRSWTWTIIVVTGSCAIRASDVVNVYFPYIPPCIRLSYSPLQPPALTDKKKPVAPSKDLSRRHTEAWEVWPARNAAPLPRVRFSRAATVVLAIVRLEYLNAKRLKKSKDDPPSPAERPLCRGWYCAYTLLRGPLVV